MTGGRVEVASFRWHPFDLNAEADGLVIHGREAAGEAPYAQVGQLQVRISVLGLWSPRILLRDLVIVRPSFHLIVYPDGSTNQPRPRNPAKSGKSPLDTLFDLKANHVAVEEGILDYENRASSFDFQARRMRLDFAANDVSLRLSYNPPQSNNPESYRIEAGARDLNIARGNASHPSTETAEGFFQASLDLTRNAVYLRSLRLTSHSRHNGDRTLDVSGALSDFTRPRWQAKTKGELDMSLLEPVTGYPNTPEGIARLDLDAQGQSGQFRVDGSIHTERAAYVGTGVNATGVGLDAHVHADPEQLIISSIVARLRQGGQLEGQVALDHWLPPIPGDSLREATPPPVKRSLFGHQRPQIKIAPSSVQHVPIPDTIPVNGKVTAQLKNVTLDTVLDIVGEGPFQRIGLDALLNGPALATWTNGDTRTLAVSSTLTVSPSQPVAATAGATKNAQRHEAPATGTIDGTYTQRDGAVDLRALDITLPASHIQASGHLGAYPLSSPTEINVEIHSHDLGEFDTVLRDLGLRREGKSGTDALPVSLGGQANFHGTWSGSLVDPHIAGTLDSTNLTIELPANSSRKPASPQLVHLDSLVASGSYSATRIAIDRGQFRHGQASFDVQAALTAVGPALRATSTPAFDSNSLLRLHLIAAKVGVDELLPLHREKPPGHWTARCPNRCQWTSA